MNKMLVVPAALVLSLSLSQTTFAYDMKKMSDNKKKYYACMQGTMKKLDLTADQKTKIVTIRSHERKAMEGKWREARALRHEMRAVVESDKLDEVKLTSLIQKRKDLMADIYKAKLVAKNEIYNLLDAKQKAAYTDMANHCEEMKVKY